MNSLEKMLADMMDAKATTDERLRKENADKKLLEAQERGYMEISGATIVVGDYGLTDMDSERLIIIHIPSGEAGVFAKSDFETHIKAFYGMNF